MLYRVGGWCRLFVEVVAGVAQQNIDNIASLERDALVHLINTFDELIKTYHIVPFTSIDSTVI